jgi:SAM-dependent methyltransferase
VGCGHGFFLDESRKRGWTVEGIETSVAPRAYATTTLGLRVLPSPLEDANLPGGSFNVISLWHVLEHVADPVQTVRQIHALLHDGGLVAIACPNIASLSAKLTGAEWLWLGYPYHLYQFSPGSLRWLLEHNGFTVKRVVTHETYDSHTLGLLLLWHWATHAARRFGMRKLPRSSSGSEADREISVYQSPAFSLSPVRLMAWLLHGVGNTLTYLLFPLVLLLWKKGYGTEAELYAVKAKAP